MVYQEQIMQAAQILAGYTLGQADLLRRAMGKKDKEEMEKQREIFVKGASDMHSIDKEKAEEIFAIMEKFAQYGFNRSHSAAYSVVAYQTAYLKAHYPAEFMASVLTHNQSNIDKITFFMDECKRQNIKVLGPDINESNVHFDVNKAEQIRFGLGAIKGAGEAAVVAIISEREENGPFVDIFDFASRVNLRAVNKKTFESLAMGGAFDANSEIHRRQYLYNVEGESSLIEMAIRYGGSLQHEKNASQQSLFGEDSSVAVPQPKIPQCEAYGEIEKLKIEKEVVGFYISGHPLDQYKVEMCHFCTCGANRVEDFKGQIIYIGGVVTKAQERFTKTGKAFGLFTIEDYDDSIDMAIFGEDYLKNRHMLTIDNFVYLTGKVEERYNQPGVWEFRTKKIQLLGDVRDDLSKGILLNVLLEDISEKFVEKLELLSKENPGKCDLKLNIFDDKEGIGTELLSKKYRVKPSNEFFSQLERIPELKYKIIKHNGNGVNR